MWKAIPLIARILLSTIFLISGIGKILRPEETQGYMEMYNLPSVTLLMYFASAVEIAGGLSVLTGFFSHWGALLLFLYLIPTTLIFHTRFEDPNQQIHFLKNLALMGGLLMVAYFGSGPLSMDAKRRTRKKQRTHP